MIIKRPLGYAMVLVFVCWFVLEMNLRDKHSVPVKSLDTPYHSMAFYMVERLLSGHE